LPTLLSSPKQQPNQQQLAARIAVSNLHKNTLKSFSETIKIMHEHMNEKNGEPAPLVADDVFEFVMEVRVSFLVVVVVGPVMLWREESRLDRGQGGRAARAAAHRRVRSRNKIKTSPDAQTKK